MKVAFFHDHRFGRDASGVHYSYGGMGYRALARYLAHFEEVVVVGRAGEADGSTRTVASGPGVEMCCVEESSPLERVLGGAIERHVREVLARVDCAIVRLPSGIGRIAGREALRAGKPWMVELVGCPWGALWNHGSLAGKVLAAPAWLHTRRLVREAPFVAYVSARFLQRRYPCTGASVACSNVLIDTPSADVLERRLRRLERAADGRVRLGLVGSLNVAYKGHETALRAVSRLARSFPDVRLLCLGEGDPSRWRRRAAALGVDGKVAFEGSLPHGEVVSWLDALDLFLIPSLTEGLPRVLVEAMSRALPAAGTAVGGIPELIEPRFTVRPGDDEALARAVAALLSDPEEMRAQARRNWTAAHAYASDVLERKRQQFLGRFAAHVARATGQAGSSRDELAPPRAASHR